MAEAEATQRIAAILAADAAGYTRLMAGDEAATIAALDEARAVFREQVADERGRIVDTAGDSVLAVFETTAGAVRAARAIQARLESLNAGRPPDRRMRFRVGVHLGDIHEKADGSVYGDGVNVAARLQALAEPGGIVVSDTVQSTLRSRAEVAFAYLGAHSVKNVAEPIRTFRLVTGGAPAAGDRRHARPLLLAAIASVALITLLTVAGLMLWSRTVTDADAPAGATNDPVLAMPTGPSIAVLPFANLTGDPSQDYFADGITEEIITGLAKFSNLRVLARNTTFQFKDQAVDIAEIGQRLGVDYVVEGSVRRAATTVRVTVQLLDSADGAHIWAETYDRELSADSLFVIQDEITSQVISRVGDIHGAVVQAHIAKLRRSGSVALEDYDCILLAYDYQRFLTPDKHAPVKACLEETVARNPNYADAWANLAYTYVDQYWTEYDGPADPLTLAHAAARKAVELDPGSQVAHHALANVYFFRDEIDAFLIEAEKALELNPNNTEIVAAIGVRLTYAEQRERGVALIDKVTRLNPAHPGWYWFPVAFHHYRSGDYRTALEFARRIDMPGFWYTHVWLAAIYGQLGDLDRARAAIGEAVALSPAFKDNPEKYLRMWFKADEAVDQMLEGLRKAGLVIPEQTN